MPKRLPWLLGAIAVLAMCLLAAPAAAQYGANTGGIFGQVVDEQGGVLPGVAVTITGLGAPQTVYSDARGDFRIINLAPGTYVLSLALQGFSTVNRENVKVDLGRNTEITIPMKLSAVAATVTVTGEVPVISTKKVETGAAITNEEMKSIPTARDPWVVLQSVPGVVVDRVNVAGSESGQQSLFVGKGSSAGTFAVDGVNLTDMAALGASAGYYDFDSFQEMQVISGGADASIGGSGTHLNMVTKRGTNEVHGSARIFIVDQAFESDNVPEGATGVSSGNHIQSLQDYGVEVGGPAWKDHIWLWGSYGRNQINLITANGLSDRTTLENFNGKFNWQVVPSNSIDAWYQRSDKLKFGRSAGLTRPPETTWDQTTPQNTWKIADSQILGSNFFFNAQYNGSNGNFTLTPQGGLDPQVYYDPDGIWHNSYVDYAAPRPQRQVKSDISYFFNTGSVGNELKAGFGYLTAGARSFSVWPGDGSNFNGEAGGPLLEATFGWGGGGCGATGDCAVVTRQSNLSIMNTYWSAYLQDAITMDRLTINLGVRWDRQDGVNRATLVPANPTPGVNPVTGIAWSAYLPEIDFPGEPKNFTWDNWQPRVGLSYALGENRTTVLKASYAQYAEALGTGTVGQTNATNSVAYAYFDWVDANGNELVEVSEVASDLVDSRNYDPADPTAVSSPNRFPDPNFDAPKTWEIVGGIDHELMPAFAVGVAYTYRKFTDQLFRYSNGLTSADYVLVQTLTGTLPASLGGGSYSAPVYEINPDIATPPGYDWINRPDYNQTYSGFDLILTKRLSNRWMMRGSFSYNINKQNVDSLAACVDPTNTVPGQSGDSGNPQTGYTAESCADNTYVAVRSTGSGAKDSVFLNSKYQFYINGMYQLPLNFNIAASFWGRQGYPIVPYQRVNGSDGIRRNVALATTDALRYENVYELDMRIEKMLPISSTANITISADLFNVLNDGTVLQQFNRIGPSNAGNIKEIQSPRVWRFGARISF